MLGSISRWRPRSNPCLSQESSLFSHISYKTWRYSRSSYSVWLKNTTRRKLQFLRNGFKNWNFSEIFSRIFSKIIGLVVKKTAKIFATVSPGCCYVQKVWKRDFRFLALSWNTRHGWFGSRRTRAWLTNHCPSVLWHCWLGHISLTRKIVSEYDLYCVEWDVKPYYTIPRL